MKTHLDLFSGIGGFALAANWAGYQTIGFCEIEDYPRRILSKRFPGIPVHRDIRELDGSQYTGCDLITGGYPCSPFSQAGQRRGEKDDRHLWPEMYRIIKQARPAFVVAENVAGHITLGLDEVLANLETEGYATRTLVLPACAKNAPHRRDRCFIIARNVADTDCKRRRLRDTERENATDAWQPSRSTQYRARDTEPGLGGTTNGLSSGLDMPRRWADGSWENGTPRVTTSKPNRTQRLKALGNAIVPAIAYEILTELDRHD